MQADRVSQYRFQDRGVSMPDVAEAIVDPRICVVRTRQGERIRGQLAELLNPVDPKTFHEFTLPASVDVELHHHDFDEYWWFTSGTPTITLRAPSGRIERVTLAPGDMIACVRGVAHTLWADHELVYFQYSSVLEGHERGGHLTDE
jgi:mannose-6-phosphate isomerase-like protein (cupin superfamily)